MLRIMFAGTILLFISSLAYSQPDNRWIRYYDGRNSRHDAFYDVFATTDSGFVMFGYSSVGVNQLAFWLVKTDRDANEQWQRTYSNGFEGNFQCWGNSVIQTDDGCYLTGGRSNSSNINNDFYFSVIRINENGDQIWWNNYPNDEDLGGECSAVIELKSGEYVATGSVNYEAYAVMFVNDGEVIWDNQFDGFWLKSVREIDGGLLFAGYSDDQRTWLLKTDFDGEVVWSHTYHSGSLRALISCQDGGFAACGRHYSEEQGGGWYLLRVNGDGEALWWNRYGMNGDNLGSFSVAQMHDDGFVLVGHPDNQVDRSGMLRTDNAGNAMWHRYDRNHQYGNREEYLSVIVDEGSSAIIAGRAGLNRERSVDGVLLRLTPDIYEPQIVHLMPELLDMSVIIGDTVNFALQVIDLQDDSLRYRWTRNGEEVEPDTVANDTSATTIVFNELGIDTVNCVVSDGELADSIQWIIHVTDLYIDSHTPDTLDVAIRRNNTVDFSVTTRAIEGDPVQYEWVYDGEILDESDDSLSIHFEHGRDHEVEVVAYRGEQNDNLIWQVTMLDLIVNYWPRELDLNVNIDTVMEFSIEPFNPDDPSLDILWTVDDDTVDNRSWTFIGFDAAGEYQVDVYASDSMSADSMSWNVMVNPNDIGQNELTLLPSVPTLYPPLPNPFNSQTSVRYALPVGGEVRLELFDVSGRLVAELVDQRQAAGWYDVVVDGSGLVSGVYFVRMAVDRKTAMKKIVLIK